jgi:tetratricopeptide (TPR) repeat protein
MGILLISLAGALTAGLGAGIFFGWVGAILPAVVAFAAAYFLLGRRVNQALEQGLLAVQREIQKGPAHVPTALSALHALKKQYGKMQFFASSSIDGQIGTILFLQNKHEEARPYLERAFVRVWHAKLMLAVLLHKKKDFAAIDELLEKTARYTPKQGLLYSTWAWMHWKAGHEAKALEILNKGRAALGEADTVLNANLLALQNGHKMKMKGYGQVWYQFGLEQHPMEKRAQRGNVRYARR